MKKVSLIIGFLLLSALATYAAYIEKFPVTVTQPDSTVVHCFASGDEFYNWVHDSNDYTLIRDPQTGFVVYADLLNDELVSTGYIVGSIDPASIGLQPGIIISAGKREQMRSNFLNSTPKPSNARGTPSISNAGQNNGTIYNIVIYIRFAGETEFSPKANKYDSLFNDTTANVSSMYRYFKEVSYGKTLIPTAFYPPHNGNVIISYEDIHPRSYYQPYNSVNNPNGYIGGNNDTARTTREHQLLKRAVDSVRSQIPPSLNLDFDNDGNVDNICFIVRGNTDPWGTLLWPHKWALYTEFAYINGKRVWDFNMQVENHFDSIGKASVLCHEMFHTLGAPDLYRYTNKTIEPVSTWDIMSNNITPPQSMTAWLKYKYGGWIDSIPEIRQGGTYTINNIWSDTNNAYKIASPNSPSEFFVIEYRNKGVYWDSGLYGSGLIIYRVNPPVSNGNADGPPDELYIFRPGGSNTTTNGTIASAHFSSQVGRTEFKDAPNNPPCFLSNNLPGGIHIRNISASGGATMSFEVVMIKDTLIAKWNNYTVSSHDTIRLATGGSAANNGIATLTRDSLGTGYTVNSDGVAASTGWHNATTTDKYWTTKFSTIGFVKLKLISKQMGSNTGPKDFKIQYRTDSASTWTDVTNGTVVVGGTNYVSGTKDSLPLPSVMNNKPEVFLRWLCTSDTSINNGAVGSTGVNRLDVAVLGELPVANYTINASASGNGVISPSGNTPVNFGANRTFTFISVAGYHIDSLFIDGVYSPDSIAVGRYTFTNVTTNHIIKVTFAIDTFVIAATAGSNGSITPSGNMTLNYGSNQNYHFTPNAGYHIDSVFVDSVFSLQAVTNKYYIFMNVKANHTIHATFALSKPDTTYYAVTICEGDFYTDNNFSNLTKDSIYHDTLQNIYGCDSIIELTLSYYPNVPPTTYAIEICEGDFYTDSNFTNLTKDSIYYDTLQNIYGCDSIIELTLSYYPSEPLTTYSAEICEGDIYTDNNFTNLTKDSIYYDTLQNLNGCDSIIELTLSYYPNVPLTTYAIEICEGDFYTDNNFTDLTKDSIYYDTLQNIYGCDSVIELTLIVNLLPNVPTISKNENVLTASEAETYQWYLDNTSILGATSRTYTYSQNGQYAVEVGNEFGCISISVEMDISDVGVAETHNYASLRIYPNPTKGQLTIKNEQLTIEKIEIYDVVGQCVYTTSLRGTKCRSNPENNNENSGLLRFARNDEISIDVSHLAAGMYFLKVDNKVVKIIKN